MIEDDKKKLVIKIDTDVNNILAKGGSTEDILIFFADSMDEIFKHIISGTSQNKLNEYSRDYNGFYTLMKILEDISHITSKMSNEEEEVLLPLTPYEEKVANIQRILTNSLQELVALCKDDTMSDDKSLFVVSNFLKAIVSTAAGLMDIQIPGGAAFLYAEIEKDAKSGGMSSIHDFGGKLSETISISEIKEHDFPAAMNYLGQQLSTTLFKGLYELPTSLQTLEVPLRAIEALLVNLLHQKYTNPHDILDQFTSNAHLSLADAQSRFRS
jgi:hypothetical protein